MTRIAEVFDAIYAAVAAGLAPTVAAMDRAALELVTLNDCTASAETARMALCL